MFASRSRTVCQAHTALPTGIDGYLRDSTNLSNRHSHLVDLRRPDWRPGARKPDHVCTGSVCRWPDHASATIRGVRTTLSAVLQVAVERQYLEKNPVHGIRLRETEAKKERRFYSTTQVRTLLSELPEPCRTPEPCRRIVLLAVLTGMRIGEILALRWKRVDLLRGTVEVAETFSEGEFGSPKTRSSHRVIPVSSTLRQILEAHRTRSLRNQPEDLVFTTPRGTPVSPKNLYNRVLAPACDRIGQPRISWHSFRHTRDVARGGRRVAQDRAGDSRPLGS